MNNWGSPSLIENICDHVFQNKTKIDKKTNSFYMWHSLCKLLTYFSRSQSKGLANLNTTVRVSKHCGFLPQNFYRQKFVTHVRMEMVYKQNTITCFELSHF